MMFVAGFILGGIVTSLAWLIGLAVLMGVVDHIKEQQ